MPIYEFYCSNCNVLFNFFTPKVETERRPACPQCSAPDLEKRPARFATVSSSCASDDESLRGLDENAMERAFGAMADELEGMAESDDPRRLARMLRRAGEASGLEAGPKLEEILGRLEGGQDVDELETEFEGGSGESDDDFDEYFRLKKKLSAATNARPRVDEKLYFF